MDKKKIAAIAALPLAGGILYAVFANSSPGDASQDGWTMPPMPVAVVNVAPVEMASTITGIGTIEAVRQVDVAAELAGRINAIEFKSGQAVQKGDVLIRLNDETDSAELKRLAARLNLATKQYNRVKKLKGLAVSDSRIDEARSTLDETRAQIDSVKTTKDKKAIVAPFDGVLGVRQVNLGQYLNPGEPIVNITDLSRFNIDFKLPEKASGQIAVGQTVRLSVDALEGVALSARITTIEPQIERGMHTVSIQGEVLESHAQLRPGLFAEVSVDLAQNQQVLRVPETAVERSTFGNTIYLAKAQDDGSFLAEQVVVETGRRFDGQVVLTKGVNAGDRVIVSGQNRLYFGATVTVKAPEESVDLSGQQADQSAGQSADPSADPSAPVQK